MKQLEKYAKNTVIVLLSVTLFWMIMNFVFQGFFFPTPKTDLSTCEILKYYTHIKGYYGLDHISKGILFVSCAIVPLTLFYWFKNFKTNYDHKNIVSTVSLLLFFLINGISLIIQGVTVEFAISVINTSNKNDNHTFAINLFRWLIQNGGISFSTYIVCNFCFIIWVIFTNSMLKEEKRLAKWMLKSISCIKIVLVPLFIFSIFLVIYQNQLAQTLFTLIDFINLTVLIIIFFKTSTLKLD